MHNNIAVLFCIKDIIQICCYSHHAAIVPSVSKPHICWAKSTKTKQLDAFLFKFQHALLFHLMTSGPFTVCQETESCKSCYNHDGLSMYVQENLLILTALIDTVEFKSKFSGIPPIFMVETEAASSIERKKVLGSCEAGEDFCKIRRQKLGNPCG